MAEKQQRRNLMPSHVVTTTATVGTPLGLVLVWALQQVVPVAIPPEVAAAIGGVVSGLVGWFARGGRRD